MMIRILSALIITFLLSILTAQAQEKTFEEKVKTLSERIEKVTAAERLILKEKIKEINNRLKNNEISEAKAQQLKKEAAENSARNIQIQVSSVEKQLQDLIQHKVDNELYTEENRRRFRIGGFDIDYNTNYRENRRRHRARRRTTSYTVVAFGLNNLVTDNSLNSLDDSEFNFWNSHFLELGINYKTRVFKNRSLLYVDYGLSVQYNTLRPKNNQFFVATGNTTTLQTHTIDLDKSKFKNVQLVVPLLFELDFSKPRTSDEGKVHYRTNRSVRIGAGGFVGVNLKTKQVLKYEVNDKRTKDRQKGDFNTNNFVYGLSAFVGHKDTSFYVKYNLNDLFKNAVVPQNNISFGVRFDW